MPSGDYLVWIDLEMTGLKPDTDSIIEIATVVTDRDLELIADGPVRAIHQPDEVLQRMDGEHRAIGDELQTPVGHQDRKSTRLNSSHHMHSYAVFRSKQL